MKRLIGSAAVAAFALVMVSNALADPRISATATVNANRQVVFNWNEPTSTWGGAVIINTTSLTDATGELPFDAVGDPTIDFEDMTSAGLTTWTTLPLDMTITEPTTVYAQVQLIDPFGDGSCSQGTFGADCDSAVIPLTIQPICTQVVVTEGYYKTVVVTPAHYTKKLVKPGHWLRRNGHYVRRHGRRVWVKAKYARVFHPAVTKNVWVPPVYSTQCH